MNERNSSVFDEISRCIDESGMEKNGQMTDDELAVKFYLEFRKKHEKIFTELAKK